MAEAQNKAVKKVWSGYECPACYGIFRVTKGNEHREAICPRCETVLRLVEAPEIASEVQEEAPVQMVETLNAAPVESASSAGSVSPSPQTPLATSESADGRTKVRKRRRKIKSSLDPDWERTEHARRREEAWKLPVILLVAGIMILIAALVTMEFLNSQKKEVESKVVVSLAEQMGLTDEPVEPEENPSLIDIESDREMILETVRLFLEAETVEEVLVMVRQVKGVSTKMKRHYLDRPYELLTVKKIAEDGAFSMVDDLVSVNVVLEDFSIRPIALEKVEGRFLVDWESWVGYSELSWERFFDIKPRRGREFRVMISPVDYYNFDFSDDQSWQSFQVTSADQATVVYGYVPGDSPMVGALSPVDPSIQSAAYVVRLRYPLNSTQDNQVLIEEVICSGWVLSSE